MLPLIDITITWADLFMLACLYLSIGVMIVLCETPQTYRNRALARHLARRGRLPHRLIAELAVVRGVLWWLPEAVELASCGEAP